MLSDLPCESFVLKPLAETLSDLPRKSFVLGPLAETKSDLPSESFVLEPLAETKSDLPCEICELKPLAEMLSDLPCESFDLHLCDGSAAKPGECGELRAAYWKCVPPSLPGRPPIEQASGSPLELEGEAVACSAAC
eukprot:6475343-Amphidinium_carterae.1